MTLLLQDLSGQMASLMHVAFIAAFLAFTHALRQSRKTTNERVALTNGLYYFRSGLDNTSKAYLMGTRPPASTWRYGPNWKDTFVGAIKKLGRTGVEVDDHDSTPIGQGETIGLVAAKVDLHPYQIDKLPSAFRAGIFGLCGSKCPTWKAAIRFSHTNAANLDLMRIALKISIAKNVEVDFHFTETLKGFPIRDYDQLNAFAFQVRRGLPLALARFPRQFARMASQQSTLVDMFGDETKTAGALGKNYYSMIPFRLGAAGPTAGAFKVRLVALQSKRHPGGGAKQQYLNNMRNQLVDDIKAGTTRFSFEIQVATDAKQHSIQDAATVWNETSAPWVRMGTVEIPKQTFRSPVTVGNVIGSGLWVNGRALFNSKELAFLPGGGPHPPIGDIGHFRSYLYPPYDRERQSVLLGKSGGAPARCPFSQLDFM